MSIAIEVGSGWGMRGHRGDFLMYSYLIFPNACDLFLNAWPPECVVHDTDPVQTTELQLFPPDGQSSGYECRKSYD